MSRHPWTGALPTTTETTCTCQPPNLARNNICELFLILLILKKFRILFSANKLQHKCKRA